MGGGLSTSEMVGCLLYSSETLSGRGHLLSGLMVDSASGESGAWCVMFWVIEEGFLLKILRECLFLSVGVSIVAEGIAVGRRNPNPGILLSFTSVVGSGGGPRSLRLGRLVGRPLDWLLSKPISAEVCPMPATLWPIFLGVSVLIPELDGGIYAASLLALTSVSGRVGGSKVD
jgi:hypothetical protein